MCCTYQHLEQHASKRPHVCRKAVGKTSCIRIHNIVLPLLLPAQIELWGHVACKKPMGQCKSLNGLKKLK